MLHGQPTGSTEIQTHDLHIQSFTCYPFRHHISLYIESLPILMYLQWDSHHTISSKYSMVGTLHHRTKTICSSPQLLQQEEEHLHKVLTKYRSPAWTLKRVKIKTQAPIQNNNRRGTKNSGKNNKTTRIPTWWFLIPNG